MPQEGYLGLGSNLGDRRRFLQRAVDLLPGRGLEVLESSSVYETEPVGPVADQPDFLNACVRVRTQLAPEQMLDACRAVEREVGRRAGIAQGPREIDVDILLLGDVVLDGPRLALPHPQLAVRRFVLVPLAELDRGLVLPGGTTVADALAALGEGGRVERSGPPLALGGSS